MPNKSPKSFAFASGLLSGLMGVVAVSVVFADAPAVINYQGKLADANGNPRSGTLPMIFRIYDAASGGNLLVSDDRTTSLVPITNGVFDVLIGSGTIVAGTKTSVAAAIQSTPTTYLQVSISGTNLSPRQRLVATPYALSVAPSSVGNVEVSTISASKINAGTFQSGNYSFTGSVLTVPAPSNPTDAASKSYVDSQVGGASQWTTNGLNIGYTTGNVGVGTTTPGTKLAVNGTLSVTGAVGGAGFSGWDTDSSDDLTINTIFSGDVSGKYNAIVVGNDSHSHTGATISGLGVGNFTSPNISQWTNDAGYVTAAGASQWTTNGTDIGYTGSGGVGIGITNPSGKLTIAGSTNLGANTSYCGGSADALCFSSANGKKINFLDAWNKYITVDPTNMTFTNVESGAVDTVTSMQIDTGANSRFRVIDEPGNEWLSVKGSNGYVGIGDTGPSNRLVVGDDSTGASTLPNNTLAVGNAGGDSVIQLGSGGSTKGFLKWVQASNYFQIGTGNAAYPVSFATNVGVGIAAPLSKLDVGGQIHSSGQCGGSIPNAQGTYLSWNQDGCGAGETDFINHEGGGVGGFRFFNTGAPGASLPAPVASISGLGNMTIAGSLSQNSDRSLKTNIQPIQNAMGSLLSLQGVSFTWKRDQTSTLGFIAQDVEKVLPTLVSTDKQGIKSLNYQGIIPVAVEAIKQQQQEIEELRTENKKQDAVNDNLKLEIERLKTIVDDLRKKQ